MKLQERQQQTMHALHIHPGHPIYPHDQPTPQKSQTTLASRDFKSPLPLIFHVMLATNHKQVPKQKTTGT